MEKIIVYIALVLVGLCLGSFAGAMIWRLRARQLVDDKAHGEDYDTDEYKRLKKLTKSSVARDRSQCLHCSYTLRWYDLLPLVSWLSLGGTCRNCHKPIGYLEPLIELGTALFFVVSYTFWPYALSSPLEITQLIIWLTAGVSLAILFVYDMKWFLLPDKVNFFVIGLGVIASVVTVMQSTNVGGTLGSIGGAVLLLSGIYLLLYVISKGKWIGFGDIKLGLGLALLLGDFRLAFIALFAANFIGCLIVIPQMAAGKLKRNAHVPFGPLLILGTVVAQLVGLPLVDWYVNALL
jgi:prepilin signal peptidase PulO-like enzyme (type II secretory pathway)